MGKFEMEDFEKENMKEKVDDMLESQKNQDLKFVNDEESEFMEELTEEEEKDVEGGASIYTGSRTTYMSLSEAGVYNPKKGYMEYSLDGWSWNRVNEREWIDLGNSCKFYWRFESKYEILIIKQNYSRKGQIPFHLRYMAQSSGYIWDKNYYMVGYMNRV